MEDRETLTLPPCPDQSVTAANPPSLKVCTISPEIFCINNAVMFLYVSELLCIAYFLYNRLNMLPSVQTNLRSGGPRSGVARYSNTVNAQAT